MQQLLAIPYPPRAPDLYGYNGRLWGNGRPLDIRGINWWGTEGVWRLPFGLLERPIDEYLDFMARTPATNLMSTHCSSLCDLRGRRCTTNSMRGA